MTEWKGRGGLAALALSVLLASGCCDSGEIPEPATPEPATPTDELPTEAETTPLAPPTTLDEAASRALGEHDAFVALDPATGEVLSLVNPDIAVRGLYPPGSTFKLITAYAALEGGLIGPHDEVSCDGAHASGDTLHPCSVRKGHGRPNVVRALAESCNVFFYELGGRVGRDRIREAVDDFTLLEPTGFDPTEPPGEFPDELPEDQLFLLGAGNLTSVRVTPQSKLVAFSGLVGDGQCRRPWRGDRPRGETRASMPALFDYQALLVDGLEGAVEYGTATAAAVPGETVLGKTGTIRNPDDPTATVNWFLGYLVERRVTACVIQTRARGVEPAAQAFGTIFASLPR